MTTETQPRESNGPLILGILLVGIGLVFLVREYIPALDWDRLWPIAIIAVGGLLLVNSMRRREG